MIERTGEVAQKLCKESERMFNRPQLMSLWQTLAENFYPERADFLVNKNVGEDFAANLSTSYPIMCREELGNNISTMLRRRDLEWFGLKVGDDLDKSVNVREYLENNIKTMRNAMYDRASGFMRATKEGDHDYATFGACVISCELAPSKETVLYRNWHLRDVAWTQDYAGNVESVFRKDKMRIELLDQRFNGNIAPEAKQKMQNDCMAELRYAHIVMPANMYSGAKKYNTPFVSIYIDIDNKFIMEEVGVFNRMYIIPRWKTVGGSQYPVSPAAITALPDARLIQAMTLILLEAGEKAVDPPMIAQDGMMRSDANFYSGGITLVDAEYDERLGDALRPIAIDRSGLQFGLTLRTETKEALRSAFYLDKIQLPPMGVSRDMTAFEVGQRVQQYVSNALPLFEPMEIEYNGEICEITYDVMARAGAFGPADKMPEELSDKDLRFTFVSPISQTVERQKSTKFQEASALLAQILPVDKGAVAMLDFRAALKDVLAGIGTPAEWLRDDAEVAAIDKAQEEQQQTAQLLATMGQGAQVAQQIGDAGNALKQGVTGGGYGAASGI